MQPHFTTPSRFSLHSPASSYGFAADTCNGAQCSEALPKQLIRSLRTDMWLRACFETVISGNRRFETPVPPIATNVASSTFEIQARRLCRLWESQSVFPGGDARLRQYRIGLETSREELEGLWHDVQIAVGSSVYIVSFAPVW
jgi:hypothetical protein